MQEDSEAYKAYQKYLGGVEGTEVDPRAASAAMRELELGKKGDFPVYAEEPRHQSEGGGAPLQSAPAPSAQHPVPSA